MSWVEDKWEYDWCERCGHHGGVLKLFLPKYNYEQYKLCETCIFLAEKGYAEECSFCNRLATYEQQYTVCSTHTV